MEGWLARLRLFRVRVYNAKRQPYTERPMVVWFQMMQRLFWVFFSFTADIFHFITHLIDLHWKQSKTLRTKKKKKGKISFSSTTTFEWLQLMTQKQLYRCDKKRLAISLLCICVFGETAMFFYSFLFFLFFYACQTRVRVSDTYVQNQH